MVHEMSLPNGDRDEEVMSTDFRKVEQKMAATLFETSRIISQKAIWQNAENHGWHNPACDLATDLLLIHSEISEACEALRKGNLNMFVPESMGAVFTGSVEEELADAVIRIFHTAQKNGFDICAAVKAKHGMNVDRHHRHGNKRF